MSAPIQRCRTLLTAIIALASVLGVPPGAIHAAPAAAVGRYRLSSTTGTPITSDSFLGKVQIVYFGFTFCPDVCPTTLSTIGRSLQQLGPQRKEVQVVFVSVDYRRDTVQTLKPYVRAFGSDIVGATGDKAAIDAVVRAFRTRYAITPTSEGQWDVRHPGSVFIVGRNGRLVGVLPTVANANRFAEQLRAIIG